MCFQVTMHAAVGFWCWETLLEKSSRQSCTFEIWGCRPQPTGSQAHVVYDVSGMFRQGISDGFQKELPGVNP